MRRGDRGGSRPAGAGRGRGLHECDPHAYQGAIGKPIQLHLEADELELRFRLRDFAGPLQRDKLQSRELDEVRPGGLGLHLMKRVFNHVEFKCLGDGTELTLSRRRDLPVQQSIAEPSVVE